MGGMYYGDSVACCRLILMQSRYRADVHQLLSVNAMLLRLTQRALFAALHAACTILCACSQQWRQQ